MNQEVTQFDAADGPAVVLKEVVYPRLSIRNTAILCKEYQQLQGTRLRSMAREEKELTAEGRIRFLALTLAGDFGLSHLHEWAVSADGSKRIVKASLMQSGKSADEAEAIVNAFTGKICEDIAMEIVDHFNAPSRVLRRQAEFEAKERLKDRKEDTTDPQ